MKIIGINIVEDNIVITLDESATSITKVYIDNLYNDKNKYATDDEKHDHVIENPIINENSIQINSKALSPELDTSAFTVLINGVLGFYYDDRELYYREVDLLTTYCSTCLDKQQKERMVLFMVKKELLEYAIKHDLVEDQISYYRDLARMLGIDIQYNVSGMCSGKCKRVIKCCNGFCALC